VAGQAPKDATASALVVVLLTALVALRPHWVQKRVRLDVAVPFALTGFGGAALGAWGSKGLSGDVLMLAFSGVLAASALLLFRRHRSTPAAATVTSVVPSSPSGLARASDGNGMAAQVGLASNGPPPGRAAAIGRAASTAGAENVGMIGGGGVPESVQDPGTERKASTVAHGDGAARTSFRMLGRTLSVGALVGVLTGVFGVGGGFVIVPALALLLGLTMAEAVGTSLLVIAANAAFTFLLKAGGTSIDWSVLAAFSGAAAVGALAGSEVSRRFDSATLTRWFVRGVAVVALYTAARSIVALAS
jgi:uncharacterized membrane protein YfcA